MFRACGWRAGGIERRAAGGARLDVAIEGLPDDARRVAPCPPVAVRAPVTSSHSSADAMPDERAGLEVVAAVLAHDGADGVRMLGVTDCHDR